MNNQFSMFFDRILSALGSEFSNFTLEELVVIVVRLCLAAMLGGLLGYERENQGKSAGIRTHILVALGAALLMLAPSFFGTPKADVTRIIQGVVTGIGFLGAGTIIKMNEIDIHGLTTAAGIWVTAAIGLAVGMGQWLPAILTTCMMMFVLSYFKVIIDKLPTDSNVKRPNGQNQSKPREN